MEPWHWAIVIKPLVIGAFMALVVAPIVWLLYKLLPMSRSKVVLFKVRDGSEATRRDRIVHWVAAIAGNLIFFGWMGYLIWRGQ